VLGPWTLFSAEVLLFTIIRLPLERSFDAYAFADRGSFLTLCYLAAHGGRPTLDFGYIYGLLPLLLGQTWFHLVGLTPVAQEAAMLVCALAGAWGLARFASAVRLGTIAIALLVAALPFAIFSSYPSLIQALEAALLLNGLAEQAAGRRAGALALATAACLVKPSMGYLYGFLLLVFILLDARCGANAVNGAIGRRGVVRALVPAIVTGFVLSAMVAAFYGVRAFMETLLPTSGMVVYRTLNLGFFHGTGRFFWQDTNGGIGFYLFSVVGFWIAASLWLLTAGLWAAWRMVRAYRARCPIGATEEFVFTCAVLHVVFVTSFFGGPTSWNYYSYVLVMGAAATSVWSVGAARTVAALALLAAIGQAGHLGMARYQWLSTAPSPVTAGLWASAAERSAWQQMARATRGRDTLMLAADGAVSLFLPQFGRPCSAYLIPGETLESEVICTRRRLERAQMVVAVTRPPFDYALGFYPDFRRLLEQRKLILSNGWFAVYGARRPG
jgi:hypothetical protein